MTTEVPALKRGRIWFDALTEGAGRVETGLGSVLVADVPLAGERARLLAIVPDPQNRFPRARQGEVGLQEGWGLARHIREAIAADPVGAKRPIIAVVDARSQAYGRLEELLGIHLSLAASADAYAAARQAGHPVVALIVGQAISGALLAHGYQAHRMLALDAPGVVIHAMHKAAAARITRRSVEELDELGKTIIPMSYDLRQYAKLGLLHELIPGIDADAPSVPQVAAVKERMAAAIADIRRRPGDLTSRLDNPQARVTRAASIEVRRRMTEQWNAS
jgi:malonate decarboxylase gamma subunit